MGGTSFFIRLLIGDIKMEVNARRETLGVHNAKSLRIWEFYRESGSNTQSYSEARSSLFTLEKWAEILCFYMPFVHQESQNSWHKQAEVKIATNLWHLTE